MNLLQTARHQLRHIDYRYLLPLSARFQYHAALPVNLIRLLVLLSLGSDWRENIGDNNNFNRRHQALAELRKFGVNPGFFRLLFGWILDEWASAKLILKSPQQIEIRGQLPDEPTLWVTAHYGASIPGAAHLVSSRRKTNALGSGIVSLDCVQADIRDFYQNKYQSLASAFNGGRVIFFEDGLREIYRSLAAGEDLIVVGDLPPPSGQTPVYYELFGKVRGVAPGPVHLASKFKMPLQAYLISINANKMVIHLGPRKTVCCPEDATDVYRFIFSQIEERPEQWWAADLLPLLPLSAEQ